MNEEIEAKDNFISVEDLHAKVDKHFEMFAKLHGGKDPSLLARERHLRQQLRAEHDDRNQATMQEFSSDHRLNRRSVHESRRKQSYGTGNTSESIGGVAVGGGGGDSNGYQKKNKSKSITESITDSITDISESTMYFARKTLGTLTSSSSTSMNQSGVNANNGHQDCTKLPRGESFSPLKNKESVDTYASGSTMTFPSALGGQHSKELQDHASRRKSVATIPEMTDHAPPYCKEGHKSSTDILNNKTKKSAYQKIFGFR